MTQEYTLMVAVCIGVPIVVWLTFSTLSLKLRLVILFGIILVSLIFYTCKPLSAFEKATWFPGKTNRIAPGNLESIQAGNRMKLGGKKQITKIGQGEVLALSGWMGSALPDHQAPEITLKPINFKALLVELKSTPVHRADVEKSYNDTRQSDCGFSASVNIPDTQPLGTYLISIKRDQLNSEWHYDPQDKIEVVSILDGKKLQQEEELLNQLSEQKKSEKKEDNSKRKKTNKNIY